MLTPSHKASLLRKAQLVLSDTEQLPITVSQLCQRIATSSSTLNRAFLEEYGMSPKSYIRARCLSSVRDELAHAPPETKIADVANRWGFWHMGQFALDFRKLFGDSPSQYRAAAMKRNRAACVHGAGAHR